MSKGLVWLFALAVTFPLVSQTVEKPSDPVIRSFQIEGLAKTKISVIEPYFRPYEGRPLSDFSKDQFTQKLRSLGIFHSLSVVQDPQENGEVIIRVYIEEKWTLIPVPLGRNVGGRLLRRPHGHESNLFGYNKKLFAGAILSSTGWKGTFGYFDPKFLGTDDTFFFRFLGGQDSVANVTMDEKVYQRYDTDGLLFSAEYGLRQTNKIILGLGAEFQEQTLTQSSAAYPSPDSGRFSSGRRYHCGIRTFSTTGSSCMASPPSLDTSIKFEVREPGLGFDELSFTAQYRKPIFQDHRAGYVAAGSFAPYTPRIVEPEIEKIMKTLPSGVVADSFLFFQAFWEYTLSSFNWGAVTVIAAYEAGIFNQSWNSPEYVHGPSTGPQALPVEDGGPPPSVSTSPITPVRAFSTPR